MEHYYGNKYALKQVFLDEFKKIGVIAPACKKAGISRGTFYRWYNGDDGGEFLDAFLKAVNEVYKTHKQLLRGIPKHKMHDYLRGLVEDDEAKEAEEAAKLRAELDALQDPLTLLSPLLETNIVSVESQNQR